MYHHDLPAAFLARMARLLGDDFDAFAASYAVTSPAGLRVNTLKMPVEAFRPLAPFDLAAVPWCQTGFTVSDEPSPGKHPYHAAGLYYLQEPSAMAVAELLDPQPGERVLDLAAAPGGKATHIAALMQNRGLLIANEIHPQRAWDLAENLERWGATNVAITNETPERLADRLEGFFDRVLLDAPCSGEGMFRKSAAARQEWSPALVAGCALRQSAILDCAARLARPGGRLVYATCTFAPEENEGVIARFLEAHPDFDMVQSQRRPAFAPGRPDWVAAGAAPTPDAVRGITASLARSVRLWPHLGPGEGHFIAILQRAPAGNAEEHGPQPDRLARLPPAVERSYRAFCSENLRRAPEPERLALVGSYLYTLLAEAPDILTGSSASDSTGASTAVRPRSGSSSGRSAGRGRPGLRFIHPGWWLGTLKGGRFEPSHALALGLRVEDARRAIILPAGHSDLLAYLRGESLHSPGEDGWILVAVDGFSLGWGKRVAGVLKNHYPRGLRWP